MSESFIAALQAAAEPVWRDIDLGVRFQLRPIDGPKTLAVQAVVSLVRAETVRGQDVLTRYGYAPEDWGALADPTISIGFFLFVEACAWGELLIEDWNLEWDGRPVEVSPETIRAVFKHGPFPGAGPRLMEAFWQIVRQPQVMRDAEGNVSARSPNGNSEGARNTASDARNSARPAPPAAGSTTATVVHGMSTPLSPPAGSPPGEPASGPASGGTPASAI
jgi:hypothetical protein